MTVLHFTVHIYTTLFAAYNLINDPFPENGVILAQNYPSETFIAVCCNDSSVASAFVMRNAVVSSPIVQKIDHLRCRFSAGLHTKRN